MYLKKTHFFSISYYVTVTFRLSVLPKCNALFSILKVFYVFFSQFAVSLTLRLSLLYNVSNFFLYLESFLGVPYRVSVSLTSRLLISLNIMHCAIYELDYHYQIIIIVHSFIFFQVYITSRLCHPHLSFINLFFQNEATCKVTHLRLLTHIIHTQRHH